MTITVLGTGTSTGVPQVGCMCEVCQSCDSRDKRLRSSILIETDCGRRILIDCTPDFRMQLLTFVKPQISDGAQEFPLWPIDALLVTHMHADHVGGMDDLRPMELFGRVPVYAEQRVCDDLRERLGYCFAEKLYPGVPSMELRPIAVDEAFEVGCIKVNPLRVMHGQLPILGFQFGKKFAYITDMKTMPESTAQQLAGTELLIINGLRHTPHPTHQTIAEAVEWVTKLGVRQAYITHLSHAAGLHAEAAQLLPPHVGFAYDGMRLTV
ncbi:MAG: MBL fold metallo-hydrolase [Bacteroidaceae bacterium]|nr:MBL fold metallo-hydrolase [Bacteroidaceae bacterium]